MKGLRITASTYQVNISVPMTPDNQSDVYWYSYASPRKTEAVYGAP
jgi:hypothetical protein